MAIIGVTPINIESVLKLRDIYRSAKVDERIGLVFTSKLRQELLVREATSKLRQQLLVREVNKNPRQATPVERQTSILDAADTPINDVSNQLHSALPNIVMEVNPNSIEFEQPKRYTRQDTLNGSVFHHFTNSKGQNNDLLTIRFQGNTGNIRLSGRTPEELEHANRRIQIWHNLWQLTREPMLLSDTTTNTFTIHYVSGLFPVPIEFTGFFTHVLKFSENAKKPFSRDYSMEFIVQATEPELNEISGYVFNQTASTQGRDANLNPQSTILTETV